MSDVILTTYSQHNVLVDKLTAAGVAHGDRIVADLVKVDIYPTADPAQVEMRFCNMERVVVHQVTEKGAGRIDRHTQADVQGLAVSEPGCYTLHNVAIHANNGNHITLTPETEAELIYAYQQ